MLELNQIYCGDCLNICKSIDDNSIDMVITSPPYDSARFYNGYLFDFENIAKELYRIIKPGGVISWIVNDCYIKGSKSLTSFKQAIFFKEQCGFLVHDIIIYQKRNFSHPQKNRYHDVWEQVQILSKGKPKTFNPIIDRKNITSGKIGNLGINTFTEKDGSKSIRKKQITKEFGKRHNVWLGNTRGQEEMCIKLNHPAMMPKWLARDLIVSFSNIGDIVFDPMTGSGTSCVEAKKLKRNYIGCDISQEYCNLSIENLNKI